AHAVDFLVGLVALAGDEHDVAGAGDADRAGDGGGAIALDHYHRGIGDAGHDVDDDGGAVLAARIVVGDHHEIGAGNGGRGHLRTLAAITLSAAAEDAGDAPGGVGAHRGQGLLERVGRVRIVDHHQRQAAVAPEAVHAPGDGLQPAKHARDV